MRSFAGRDILSLKDFERQEFFRVFEIAARLEPIARERQMSDLLNGKILVTGRTGGAGGQMLLARYNANGTLDTTFSGDGRVAADFGPLDDYGADIVIDANDAFVRISLNRDRRPLAAAVDWVQIGR